MIKQQNPLERKIKTVVLESIVLNWVGVKPIQALRNDLDEAEAAGATEIQIEVYGDDSSYLECVAIQHRPETDEEYYTRLEEQKAMAERVRQRELTMLEQLKQKYENP
jgi:hypothetical protein